MRQVIELCEQKEDGTAENGFASTVPAPKRLQRKRVRGWRMPRGAVYVGRPTKWGNPFRIGEPFPYSHSAPLTRQESVEVFRSYLTNGLLGIRIEDVQQELRGKDLVCWCPLGLPCHADVLLEIANGADIARERAAGAPKGI